MKAKINSNVLVFKVRPPTAFFVGGITLRRKIAKIASYSNRAKDLIMYVGSAFLSRKQTRIPSYPDNRIP